MALHKLVELLTVEQLVEPLIEQVSRGGGQLRVRDPQTFLSLPVFACAH